MVLTIVTNHTVIYHLRIGVFKSPVFDFLRHSPTNSITKMIMIIANTAATVTTMYSHTCRGVVGSGSVELVGRGLEFRLGCGVTSVWVVDVISTMGVGVTEGEGSTVIGILAQLVGSVWKNIVD